MVFTRILRGPELAGEIAGDRLERRLGRSHPVVDRPGDPGVEGERDDRAAGFGHQWRERRRERLQRVAAHVEGGAHRAPRRLEEAAAEAVRRARSRSRGRPRRRRPSALRTCSATACTWATSVTSISSTSGTGLSRCALLRVRLIALPNEVSTTSAPAACAAAAIAKAMLLGVSTPVTTMRLPRRRSCSGVDGFSVLTGDVPYKARTGSAVTQQRSRASPRATRACPPGCRR